MKQIKYIFLVTLAFSICSCNIDELPNPNGPSIEGVLLDANKSELQTLVTGSEDLLRQEVGFYYDVVSIIGREYYFFTGSDPRYTGELLGKGDATLDNAGFYGTRPYFGRYRNVKNLNVLIDAASVSSSITAAELKGYLGFAKTFQAYELSLVANLQFDNGIRTDVSDIDNLGPFRSYNEALADILALLDEANSDLSGSEFAFNLSSAMADFNTPATFAKFNRALSARIALYLGNKSDAVSRLAGSFMTDDVSNPSRFYSSAGGDFLNNLFRVPGQADAIIAHPSYAADAEAGDARLAKVLERDTLSLDGLSGTYDVWVYKSNGDFVPFITRAELMLINAEANIGSDNGKAVSIINTIRSNNGVADYTGATTDAALINEVLYQRRYSLFGEGHRWIDMRRFGKLSELPIDRVGDDVWVQLPRPVSEPQ
ncbi:MAG: hypothetical protein ACJA1A_000680 [Saprospiraceae bacterium]|jgi:hypothetical protein